ncbi:prolipoprotein diacylglyceryl transferase family protein, partial [Bacteroidota bacterium]
LFGSFLTLIFFSRFLIEFIKEDQAAFEAGMSLNMGQWLSIPLVIIGLFFMLRKKLLKQKVQEP